MIRIKRARAFRYKQLSCQLRESSVRNILIVFLSLILLDDTFFAMSLVRQSTQRRHNQEHRCRQIAGKIGVDTTITPRGVHTFLLFSSLPFITYLDRAYAEDDGDEEEEDTAYDARGDRFVLDASRYGKLHLFAHAEIRS